VPNFHTTTISRGHALNMKFALVTLLLASVTLASPAPVAEPGAEARPAPIESVAQLDGALAARHAEPVVPEIVARTAGIRLDSRDPKKSKPKGNNGNSTSNSSAISITPSRALELGALGLGIMEVVRLWG